MSCSNVFQECKANIIKELKKNGTSTGHPGGAGSNRFRSAPIITFMETGNNNLGPHPGLPYPSEEPHFV